MQIVISSRRPNDSFLRLAWADESSAGWIRLSDSPRAPRSILRNWLRAFDRLLPRRRTRRPGLSVGCFHRSSRSRVPWLSAGNLIVLTDLHPGDARLNPL